MPLALNTHEIIHCMIIIIHAYVFFLRFFLIPTYLIVILKCIWYDSIEDPITIPQVVIGRSIISYIWSLDTKHRSLASKLFAIRRNYNGVQKKKEETINPQFFSYIFIIYSPMFLNYDLINYQYMYQIIQSWTTNQIREVKRVD